MLENLDGQAKERYRGALALVQAERAVHVGDVYAGTETPMPTLIAEMVADGRDFSPKPIRPQLPQVLTKSEACMMLLVVLQSNPVAPFEIETKDDVRRAAAADLSVAMGLGSQFGRNAFDSLGYARSVLHPRSTLKWWLVGAGAVALVVGTGGLALAAGPGLAGAAAVTSALATFGPGGMVGGLITAGALSSGGMGAIASGLATSASVESVESIVIFQLAVCRLRHLESLEQPADVSRLLEEIERQVIRELVRVEAFSDDDAGVVKSLKMKLKAVQAALAVIRERQWTVQPSDDVADEWPEGTDEVIQGVVV